MKMDIRAVRITTIDDFIAQDSFVVAGVSRTATKFGNLVYHELKAKGKKVFGVNPSMAELHGEIIYPDLAALPEVPQVLVTVVPPARTLGLVQAAAARGIRRVWMQPGSESSEALAWCEANQISLVHSQCIMMFSPQAKGIHRFHRFINKCIGKHPD